MTMLDYSDESSGNSSNSSNDSEVIVPSKARQRSLLGEIKENPDLYTTRRSERNRKEPSRFNILSERGSHSSTLSRKIYSGSTSDDNDNEDEDEDSDYIYTKRNKKYNYKRKMEFRKRTNVSYKEIVTSEDEVNSDNSGQPKKKVQKLNNSNGFINVRDNPLVNSPLILIRGDTTRQNECIMSEFDSPLESDYINKELNIIEEVLSFRVGCVGDTGLNTSYYNKILKKLSSMNNENKETKREPQYLIKWRDWSHIHSTWESETSILNYPNLDGVKKLLRFKEIQKQREVWKRQHASPEDLDAAQFEEERNETLLQQKMECERIIDAQRSKNSESVNYLLKWKTLDYRYSTWESGDVIVKKLYPHSINEFEERSKSTAIPNRKCEALTRRPKFIPIREQPGYLSSNPDMKLRDYQLDGMNWLAHAWTRGNSVILADEMGLGKTIQTIGFLSYLFNQQLVYGPFLLVVPLSTIGSWQSEFNAWAPYLNVIIYTGDAVSRQVIRECEWYFPKKKMLKFHVCITTYELLLKDKDWLNKISWAFLGVDEAHRLKNDESQLYNFLITFDTNSRLLITGTPVHNSLRELWALLHFIMPDKFSTWPDFEDRYNISNESRAVEIVSELYKVLEPFLLRRTKKDVEKSLPSKSEQIIRVPMCRKQAELYKLILTKNYEALSKETRGHTSTFLNIVMELKKCCNHVQLVNPIDEETEFKMDPDSRLRYYIKSSGKMMLLDKLMFELKEQGHRVLIFSQMVRMLDIISEYLVLRGWGFQRLDGSIKGNLRKQAIDHFNADGSTDFCFLLSTRAGGLGINLASADTVIIFDSDWNPQNDLQAMARAHRIGQKRQVSVYRFVIKNSIEEKIIECAKRKMVLDHLVIQRMDSALHKKTDANKNQPFSKDELNEILKFGAADLFNQDEELDEEQELNIHDILQRAETRDNDDEDTHNPANDLLSAFKVVNITETAEDEDIVYIGHKGKPKLWSDIVPQDIREKIKEEEQQKALLDLELGPRQRKKVKAYQVGQANSSTEESTDEEETDNKELRFKLTDKEIKSIIKVMKKFPRPLERIQSIMVEAEIIDHADKEVYDVIKQIINGCNNALSECDSEEKKNKATYSIRKIVINVKNMLQSIEDLDVLHIVLPKTKEERMKFELPFETKLANWSCMWETDDDAHLLVGVFEKGLDNWEAIKMDPDLKLTSKILPSSVTERPQSSHLRTRVEYLLKKLRDLKNVSKAEPEIVVATTKKIVKSTKSENLKKSKPKLKVSHVSNPKSAEFVDSSDNSSNGSIDSKNKTKLKNKTNKSKSGSDNLKQRENKSSGSNDPEKLFYEMQGPLFDKCTKKMKPIKSKLKFLEDMQRRNACKINIDDKQLSDCLLGIGNHIRSVILNFDNDEEKRQWRNYLWSFVNFFFDVFPKETLHRIYKRAYKNSSESKASKNSLSNKTNSNSKNDATNSKFSDNIKEFKSQSDKIKCNFEAKSYQEYIKMKNWNGQATKSSLNNYNRNIDKAKPYERPNYNDRLFKSSYRNKEDRCDFDRNRKSMGNSYHSNNYDNNYKQSSKSGSNISRDPRLSKPSFN